MSTSPRLRNGLPPLPGNMRSLPIGEQGLPVPFFVQWIDDKPDFRVTDGRKFELCIRDRRCWICGKQMGRQFAFVIGPISALNRVASEPPSHLDCAQFAVQVCPFMTRPEAARHELDDLSDHIRINEAMLDYNPGVTALWITDYYAFRKVDPGFLFHFPLNPKRLIWWCHGRPATSDEVLTALERGVVEVWKTLDSPEDAIRDIFDDRLATLKQLIARHFKKE